MYTPKHFEMNDPAELTAFMQHYNFAALVTSHEGNITASHLPFMLDASRGEHGTLIAHLAHTNPQWQTFASGQEALVIFTGPHAYVSPSWYEKPTTNVPTWNYTAVHAYGVDRERVEERVVLVEIERVVLGVGAECHFVRTAEVIEPKKLIDSVGCARGAPPPLQIGGFVQSFGGMSAADSLH